MDIEHTADSEIADEQLDHSLTLDDGDNGKRQLELKHQLAAYEESGGRDFSLLMGPVANLTATAVEITAGFGNAIKANLAATNGTLEDFEQIKEPLSHFFKASRQVDRYCNFMKRIDEDQRCVADGNPKQSRRPRLTMQKNGGRQLYGPATFRE